MFSLLSCNILNFDFFSLEYGKDIVIELSNLEFDEDHKIPIRFSVQVGYYETQNRKN